MIIKLNDENVKVAFKCTNIHHFLICSFIRNALKEKCFVLFKISLHFNRRLKKSDTILIFTLAENSVLDCYKY